MTVAEFRRMIENHSPGSLIPRDWLLDQLGNLAGESLDVESWVDTVRASEITGEKPEHLRHRAVTWRGMPNPAIRVTKSHNDNHLSRWLFAEEDCWAYARRKGVVGPQSTTEYADVDDADAIADGCLGRIVPNL